MRDRHKAPGEMLMQIALPEDLHHLVKLKATEQRTTLKAYVIDTLRKSVETGGKRKEPRQTREE